MKVKYIMTKNTYSDNETERVGYGIAAVKKERGNQTVVQVYNDMSAEYEKVKGLVRLCNKGRLSLIHLPDVVEDFITVT